VGNANGGHQRTIPLWAKAALLYAGYLVAAQIGDLLSIQRTFATFWPPAGLVLAMLLVSERGDWPVLIAVGILGNISSDLIQGRTLLVTMGFSTANALEALVGATLLGRVIGHRPRLRSLREAFAFSAIAAVLAPVVGATVGAIVVSVAFPGGDWWTTWYTWWIGDVLGIILVGSLILTSVGLWDEYRDRHGTRWRAALAPLGRATLVAVPFSVLAYALFAPAGGGTSWKFLVTPAMIGAGITGGPLGASAGLLVIALGGIAGMQSTAPFAALAAPIDAIHVLQAQAFFAVGGVATLSLAGVIAENRKYASDARAALKRFRLLFENMREGVTYCRMITDKDGRPVDWIYLQVNDAFEEISGMRDIVGKRVSELNPGLRESAPEVFDLYAQVAATGRPVLFESASRVPGRILRISVTSPARGDFSAVFEDVTVRVIGEKALADSNKRLEKMVYDVAESMGSVVDARDPYTQGHQVRVAVLAYRIGREMRLSQEELDGISMAGLLHDIGKLRIPAEILTKPGRLSEAERCLIREHPRQGYDILRPIDFPWAVADTVLQHHERLDGSGYPEGLAADDILMSARILAVADVVEAMSSDRPYRPLVGLPEAIEEISTHPELYDATVVAACLRLYERGETGLQDSRAIASLA
jgi:putative nucleotidyltransferase with HDIG domain